MKLQLHQIGCLVKSIEESTAIYRKMFGDRKISGITRISSQGVNVCFVETAPGVFLELIESVQDDSAVARLIKKNLRYYHAAYLTEDFDNDIRLLAAANCMQVNTFMSEAFQGKRCAFFCMPDGAMIEVIERQSEV